MKRIWKELLLLLLAAALLPLRGACAGAEISPAAQFRQDGRLYVFAALTQWPQEAAEEAEGAAALRSGDLARDLPADHPPQRVADSGTPVSYLLLVDCSTSMTRFGGQVREMAEELAEADETGAAFTLATFGDAFHVVSAGLTGEELAAAVSEVGYIAQRSDISQGILDAAGYLRENQRQTGELTNLVIVTDGIPKYSEDSPALTEVAGELDSSILVHTFGLGGSRAEQRSLAEIGQGVHIHGGKAPGETIARYVNDLCALSFPWELDGQRSAAEIRFTWADGSEEIMPLDLNAAPCCQIRRRRQRRSLRRKLLRRRPQSLLRRTRLTTRPRRAQRRLGTARTWAETNNRKPVPPGRRGNPARGRYGSPRL